MCELKQDFVKQISFYRTTSARILILGVQFVLNIDLINRLYNFFHAQLS